jgi:hypothetical protein
MMSVMSEHGMAVGNSHACHHAPAAFLGYLLGTPVHSLKLLLELIYTSVSELQL